VIWFKENFNQGFRRIIIC